MWWEYGPARYDPNTTDVHTYYLINKGGEQNGSSIQDIFHVTPYFSSSLKNNASSKGTDFEV